jgi:hypothetical protein
MNHIESMLVLAGGRITCARCTAKVKASQAQCRKPAVRGKTKCRTHGGASTGPKTQAGKDAIRRARFKHGQETLQAKAARSDKAAEMQALEDIMYVMNMTATKRTRGRKALGYVPIKTFDEARQWVYLNLLNRYEAENNGPDSPPT